MRGYKEEGTTTTPFDMCVLNDLDRFHLVQDVIDRVPKLGARAAYAKQAIRDKLIEHKQYIAGTARTCPRSPAGRGGRRRCPEASARRRPTTSEAARKRRPLPGGAAGPIGVDQITQAVLRFLAVPDTCLPRARD